MRQNRHVAIETHRLVLVRHGETEWSKSGQHTSRTDLDLTERGREKAKLLADLLACLHLDNPYTVSSPRKRAVVTAELAGLSVDHVTPLLAEWDYGSYEGLTTDDIRAKVPGWLLWTDGAEGGESLEQVGDRADKAIALAVGQMDSRDVVFVGHGHFSRAIIARWVELPVSAGARFAMPAASLAVCGFEHGLHQVAALGLTPAGYQ